MTDDLELTEQTGRGFVIAGATVAIRRSVEQCRAVGHDDLRAIEQLPSGGGVWTCMYCGDPVPAPAPEDSYSIVDKMTVDLHAYVGAL